MEALFSWQKMKKVIKLRHEENQGCQKRRKGEEKNQDAGFRKKRF
jgi:hypothetical protein